MNMDTFLVEEENTLRAQLCVLNELFTKAAKALHAAGDDYAFMRYGQFVVRAQNCCRQTVNEIQKLVDMRTRRTQDPAIKEKADTPKSEEPAIKAVTQASGNEDPAIMGSPNAAADAPPNPLNNGHTRLWPEGYWEAQQARQSS